MSLVHLATTAGLVMSAVMLALWNRQRHTANAATVDVAWSFGTGVVGVWLVLGAEGGVIERKIVLAAMIGFWSARLGLHLLARVSSEPEDGRYQRMRAAMGDRADLGFLAFFLVQAWWTVLFALPVWAAARSAAPLGWLDAAGVSVFVVAVLGEQSADSTLARFRADPANRGQVCDLGLWRYSRHPNYFFEWIHWWAYPLVGAASPVWWVAAAGIPVMYLFLTRFTGIPHTEAQSLARRGAAYREYQRRTSAFIPLPPRAQPDGLETTQENGR